MFVIYFIAVLLSICGWTTMAVPTVLSKGCAICDRITNVSLCTVTQQCPSNEMCSIIMILSGRHLVYELGCEQKTQCDYVLAAYKESHGNIIGKRDHGDIVICSACCDSWNCNKDDCIKLRNAQKCNDHSICGP